MFFGLSVGGNFLPFALARFASLVPSLRRIPLKSRGFEQWHTRCFTSSGMNVSLYQAAAALTANSRWQDVISGNLASSSIPGFKKQELSLAAVRAGLMPSSNLNGSNLPQFFTVPKAASSTSFLAGEMQATDDKNDVAIEGK